MRRFYNESDATPKRLFLKMCKRLTEYILDRLNSVESVEKCIEEVGEAKEFIRQLLEIDKDKFDNSEYREILENQITILDEDLETLENVIFDIKTVEKTIRDIKDDSLRNA